MPTSATLNEWVPLVELAVEELGWSQAALSERIGYASRNGIAALRYSGGNMGGPKYVHLLEVVESEERCPEVGTTAARGPVPGDLVDVRRLAIEELGWPALRLGEVVGYTRGESLANALRVGSVGCDVEAALRHIVEHGIRPEQVNGSGLNLPKAAEERATRFTNLVESLRAHGVSDDEMTAGAGYKNVQSFRSALAKGQISEERLWRLAQAYEAGVGFGGAAKPTLTSPRRNGLLQGENIWDYLEEAANRLKGVEEVYDAALENATNFLTEAGVKKFREKAAVLRRELEETVRKVGGRC